MPGQIKIDDGSGNYTVLTNGGSLGSDKTITIPNTTGTMALTSDSFGKVLQVVSTTSSTAQTTSSYSYVDVTGLSVSITPSSTSNKILVMYNDNAYISKGTGIATGYGQWQILRDTTALSVKEFIQRDGVSGQDHYNTFPMSITYLDSPSSTSSLTYKVQMKNGDSTTVASQFRDELGTIIAMEIAG